MASQLTEGRELSYEDNVVRYCAPRNIVDGMPIPEAFKLRSGEDFLSTNWLEYFHPSDRQLQISGVQRTLEDKGFRVNRNGGFAVLNVETTSQRINNTRLNFVLLGQTSDPSHTGVFGIPEDDADIAIAIAKSVRELHSAVQIQRLDT